MRVALIFSFSLSLSQVLSKGCTEREGWDKGHISIATVYIEMTALLENLREEEEWEEMKVK